MLKQAALMLRWVD